MHLLFDLDGTLTDSRAGIFRSLRHALSGNGLPVPDEGELLGCIGPPIHEALRKLIGPDRPELLEPVLTSFRGRYTRIGLFENEVYPEIEAVLIETRRLGHTLHVATAKVEDTAKRILAHFRLSGYFTSIHGSGLDGTRADKAELIAHVLEQERIDPAEAVMIGDREHDMIGAARNGIPAIGALWGYGSGRELMEGGATLCARVPRLLPDLIATLR